MKYACIDIETTGLDSEKDQILEFGCVLDVWPPAVPIAELPRFQCYISHDRIEGHPMALAMNERIIGKIANRSAYPEDKFMDLGYLRVALEGFLISNGFLDSKEIEANNSAPIGAKIMKPSVTCAGKNFAKFDWPFLETAGIFWNWTPRHRVLDPVTMYLRWEDEKPPALKDCLERAGINPKRFDAHTAIGDCEAVIALLRYGMCCTLDNRPVPKELL